MNAQMHPAGAVSWAGKAPRACGGGGTPRLVDELLAAGCHDLTVLDRSRQALEITRYRLGDAGGTVSWLAEDITETDLSPARFDLWHHTGRVRLSDDHTGTPGVSGPSAPVSAAWWAGDHGRSNTHGEG